MKDLGEIGITFPTLTVAGSALATPRSSAVAMIDEGNTLEEQGRHAEAMALYESAVQVDPQCARAHLNRGNILIGGGQFDEARAAYERAIACDPHYAAFEVALRNYQEAISLKRDFVDALVAAANVLDTLSRTTEAMESYERALAINPAYAEVHLNLALLAISRGRLDDAVNSLERAAEIQPDFIQAHRTLGTVLSRLGRIDAAEASLRRALSLEPESAEILRELEKTISIKETSTRPPSQAASRRLHIGGQVRSPGWEVLDANPGPCVDHVGNASDLQAFDDNSFDQIYASHVVEHFDYHKQLVATLKEWCRVLKPRGTLLVSVPDLDVLARLFLDRTSLTADDRYLVMRMIFGGHIDKYDYHLVGLNEEFLTGFLQAAGFVEIRRVADFGLFQDTSSLKMKGIPISLNVVAAKGQPR